MRPLFLPLLLLPAALAGSLQQGLPCNPLNTHLNPANKQLTGDCDSTAYCSSNITGASVPAGSVGVCRAKGCRRDEYPFGYESSNYVPPRCAPGSFCPDEEDACQPLLPVGSPCQLNRDDECSPPPDAESLDSSRSFNGSVCLGFVCLWANVSEGEACVVENTVYTGYYADGGGGTFYDVVSRDNCIKGNYCDGVSRECVRTAQLGEPCGADKECSSYNCLPTLTCGPSPDTPSSIAPYIWAVLAAGIILSMALTSGALYVVHRRQRARAVRQRRAYWEEQGQYREIIAGMRGSLRPAPALPGSAGGGGNVPRYRDEPEGTDSMERLAKGEERVSAVPVRPSESRPSTESVGDATLVGEKGHRRRRSGR